MRSAGSAAWLALLAACGAAPRGPASDEARRATEEAAHAWASLDPARAAQLAERALALGAGDEAREVAARSELALGRLDRAASVLEGTSDPALLRLRARAQMGLARYGDAVSSLEAAQRLDRAEDAWTEDALGAARAASEAEHPYAIEGAAHAELALLDLPLPVVRVRAGTVETLALVGSGADLVVIDPALRASSGVLDELALGGLRVRDVPFLTRPLAPVRDALGEDVGLVIGADLLLRLHATLDGPGRRLVVHAEPPPREDATAVPFVTPGASFVVVPVEHGGALGWMSVDTAGLFPVALTPAGEEALELGELEWRATGAGPALATVDALRLGDLVVEEIPVVRGLLDDEHARAVGAPIAGSLGWALLGQLRVTFDGRARRLRFE